MSRILIGGAVVLIAALAGSYFAATAARTRAEFERRIAALPPLRNWHKETPPEKNMAEPLRQATTFEEVERAARLPYFAPPPGAHGLGDVVHIVVRHRDKRRAIDVLLDIADRMRPSCAPACALRTTLRRGTLLTLDEWMTFGPFEPDAHLERRLAKIDSLREFREKLRCQQHALAGHTDYGDATAELDRLDRELENARDLKTLFSHPTAGNEEARLELVRTRLARAAITITADAQRIGGFRKKLTDYGALPTDPATGAPFRYEVTGATATLSGGDGGPYGSSAIWIVEFK